MRPFPSQMLALTSLARPMLSTFFKVSFQHLQSSRQEQSKYGWGRGYSSKFKTESQLVPYSKNLSHNTLNKYNTASPRGKDEKKEIFMILDLVNSSSHDTKMIIFKYFFLLWMGSIHAEIKGLFSGISPCLAFYLAEKAVSLAVLITQQQQQTPDQLAVGFQMSLPSLPPTLPS